MKKGYKICTRCIMDTSDPEIEFDENGICNIVRTIKNEPRKSFTMMKLVNKNLTNW